MKSFMIALVLVLMLTATVNAETKIYAWSNFSTLENSKANEYLSYKGKESLFGLGIMHDFNKNLRLEVNAGLGRSDTNVDISQTAGYLYSKNALKRDTIAFKLIYKF